MSFAGFSFYLHFNIMLSLQHKCKKGRKDLHSVRPVPVSADRAETHRTGLQIPSGMISFQTPDDLFVRT